MTIRFGCIADDFTGATDLAGLVARAGAQVSLRIGLPAEDEAAHSPVEIVALKSRTIPVAEAVSDSRAALAWLRRGGARHIYFKYCSTFDSTAAGNIGPVAAALLADLGQDRTVYCPAFPENDRRVFMGHLFVGRLPLHESPMKDHPLTPMRDSCLMRLLAPQIGEEPGLIDLPVIAKGVTAVRDAIRAGPAHLVADAVTDADLLTLAQACAHLSLSTGGSAFGAALALVNTRDSLSRASRPRLPDVGEGQITLSGSCSAATRLQVRRYAADVPSFRLDPQLLATEGDGPARQWLAAQNPVAPKLIYATAEPQDVEAAQARLGVEKASAIVEQALAQLAQDALAMGIRRFVVAGGETSGAVAGALAISRLAVGPQIVPGVPWTFADTPQGPVALALKSGNFGGEDFFAKAHAMLKEEIRR